MADDRLQKLLHKTFFVGHDHYSQGTYDGSNVKYFSCEGKPGKDLIEQHLAGEIVLGAYQLLKNDKVSWACWDVDSIDLKVAKQMAEKLLAVIKDIPHAVEFSGNKGYHIFLFFKEPEPASRVKFAMDSIARSLGFPRSGESHVEVYPKQEKLTDSNPLGNLIKVPLARHPKSGNWSFFVDPEHGWESGKAKDPVAQIEEEQSTLDELTGVLAERDPESEIVHTLQTYWSEGQRHEMALYSAGLFAVQGWEQDRAIDVVSRVCELTGDDDTTNRIDAVESTFKTHAEGRPVAGFQGLAEILPTTVLNRLVELCGSVKTNDSVVAIDKIRLGKGRQAWQKVRAATNVAYTTLVEKGRLVRHGVEIFWLEYASKSLLSFDSPYWPSLLYREFGLNLQEAFGRQVEEGIKQIALEKANEVQIYRRSYWDNREYKLYINLGGPEIYVLDGNQIKVIYNGEGPILFRNYEDSMDLPNVIELGVEPINPRKFIIDDVSFALSDEVAASASEQQEMVWAWFISVCLAQSMPTRPLLVALGPPGSGKTTFARRIVRFYEGLSSDVLSLAIDKPDSFRSIIAQHRVFVLDNLEKTKANWLLDDLNRVATGTKIEIRKLWTSNEVYEIYPDVFVIATATQLPFYGEETLHSRILPVELDLLQKPRPEFAIQKEFAENFAALWLGMMQLVLNPVVAALKKNREIAAPTSSRLADFTAFCARIADSGVVNGESLMSGLEMLSNRQRKILQDSSPFIQALELWLSQASYVADKPHSIGELNQTLGELARRNHINWIWTSNQGLAQHLRMLDTQLVRLYGMEVEEGYNSAQGRKQKSYSFKIAKVNV